MSETRSYRLRLAFSGSLPDRARVALRHALSMSEEELAKAGKLGSFEVDLRPLADEQKDRLVANLEGVAASFSPSLIKHSACALHPRLAEGEICPRCEARTCAACRTFAGLCPACVRRGARKRTFRNVRISVLLVVLAVVAIGSWRAHRAITSWRRPVVVAIHPYALDDDPETTAYVRALQGSQFQAVREFIAREGQRYASQVAPEVEVEVQRPLEEPPPLPPEEPSAIDAILFSLQLRWWTFSLEHALDLPPANVRLYVLYHRATPGTVLDHSIGLPQGHVGIVHAFASSALDERNQVVVAHELLHTAGATDKYDESGPAFPDGYAEPERTPLFPQARAEIMSGMLPLGRDRWEVARSLAECAVGALTAEEIGWRSTQ